MHDPKRILILRRKAIGDVVVSLAVARALRRQWPEARLEMLVDRFAAPVAQGCSELDEVVVYDRRRMSQGNPISRALNIRRFLLGLRQRRYDIVLDLMGTPQTAIWTRVIGAPIRIGRRRRFRSWAYTHVMPPDDGPTRFAGDVFLDWLRPLGIEPGPWVPVPIVASRKEQTREDRVLADHAREDRARIDHARNDRARTGSDQPFVVLNPSATWRAQEKRPIATRLWRPPAVAPWPCPQQTFRHWRRASTRRICSSPPTVDPSTSP